MSGICGIWSLEGDEAELGPVLAQLERRGPDGMRQWTDGPVALGHSLLATTPEALVEQLPLTDADSGCTITADVRLDNRAELIAALGLDAEARTIGDGELILRAYLRWGEDCPTRLLGDFAFAIWDPRTPRLFCARDHMGMRQFNYCHVPGKLFAFATIDTALLALEAVPRALDEGRIADFIADLAWVDFESTFFTAIRRLPPAHSLSVGSAGLAKRRYWQLRPGPLLELESDEAYAAAFLDVFTDAVRCRLRHSGGIGAMLSGGLDSTSVVAVASRLFGAEGAAPLTTISAISPDATHCPESQAIRRALTIEGLNPLFVDKTNFNGMSARLLSEFRDLENPSEVHGTMVRNIYLTASANGVKVVLDGVAGDAVLTPMNRIAALLSQLQFKSALGEFEGERRFCKPQSKIAFAANVLLPACWVAFAPLTVRKLWRDFRLSKPLEGARRSFSRRVRFADRRRAADRHIDIDISADRERRAQAIGHPNLAAAREQYDQLAGSAGVECRDPFIDIRLIEFCLSLPSGQLQNAGWRKVILRRAVESISPGALAWRRGKEHLGREFTRRLIAQWPGWDEDMCDPQSPLGVYLSSSTLRSLRAAPDKPRSDLDLRLFALNRFLRRYSSS